MTKPFIVFTSLDIANFRDVLERKSNSQGAEYLNAILNERGTRVGKIDVVLQGPISATVWSHNLDRTHFTHEALLLGQRDIEK